MAPNIKKPCIMGILNVTPDSFSDGGKWMCFKNARLQLHQLIHDGADIIDIGGESTRPGSMRISHMEELNRVKAIIDYIFIKKLYKKVNFSIDTYKASIAEYALTHGFSVVNDVTSLRGDRKMLSVLLRYRPFIILTFSKNPVTHIADNSTKNYRDVMASLKKFLTVRIAILERNGFPKENIIIDPGMGSFASSDHAVSFEIIKRLKELISLKKPIAIGISRKLSRGKSLEEKDNESTRLSLQALHNGATIIRVHNVSLMRQTLKLC